MFPSEYFGLFPAFPENNRVFCAMPFSERFNVRWDVVIEPAFRAAGLEPYRVDLSKVSDSIPLKIMRDIGTSRLVFADISSEKDGSRNANVMYELGMAQATRLPEEVLVFRSDSDRLPFDIAPIFADTYQPEAGPGSIQAAKEQITLAARRTMEGIDLTRHLVVQRIVDKLDAATFEIMAHNTVAPFESKTPTFRYPVKELSREARLASSRLLQQGVIRAQIPDFLGRVARGESPDSATASEVLNFEFTPLGAAVAREFSRRFFGDRDATEAALLYFTIESRAPESDLKLSNEHIAEILAADKAGTLKDFIARMKAAPQASQSNSTE